MRDSDWDVRRDGRAWEQDDGAGSHTSVRCDFTALRDREPLRRHGSATNCPRKARASGVSSRQSQVVARHQKSPVVTVA